VGKIADFGHKQGKGFGERAACHYPIFLGVPSTGNISSHLDQRVT